MISRHQRDNHERTDDLINDLDCLLIALELVADAAPAPAATREINSAHALRRMAQAKVVEIVKSRAVEWIGIGGDSELLTDAEKAEAREQ